ncbi:MAG TPA: hypothetical protein VJY65_00105 [Chloroflexota bacterium]|jgi:hypothetical protein|nr:hypothetical protein [Chloroflexota bacterium]
MPRLHGYDRHSDPTAHAYPGSSHALNLQPTRFAPDSFTMQPLHDSGACLEGALDQG